MGVADTVCRRCLRSVKADGKERPATLGVVVSSPTGKNPHDRVLRTPRQEENGRHLHWLDAASSSLVRAPARAARRPAPFSRWGPQTVPAWRRRLLRPLICWGVRAETGAIPAIGVFAAAALRAAVPAGGRRSKPSPLWRRRLYALAGSSALSASRSRLLSRQSVGGRCPLSNTPSRRSVPTLHA